MKRSRGNGPFPSLLIIALSASACGPTLSMQARQTPVADDLTQTYRITVFASSSVAAYYTVDVAFSVPLQEGVKNLPLPDGDSIQLNGENLEYSSDSSSYIATGRSNPGVFAFAWNHAGKIYANTATANLYPLQTIPITISKNEPQSLVIKELPTGVIASASVNAGTEVQEPFFNYPVLVTGVGSAASKSVDLSTLASGYGVLTVLEKSSAALAAPTAKGGALLTTIQFGFIVKITD